MESQGAFTLMQFVWCQNCFYFNIYICECSPLKLSLLLLQHPPQFWYHVLMKVFSGTVNSGSVHGHSTSKLSTCGLRRCLRTYMVYSLISRLHFKMSVTDLLKLGDLSVESNIKSYTHVPRGLGIINYSEMRNWWLLRDVSISLSIVNSFPLQNIFPSLQSITLLSLDRRGVRLFVFFGEEKHLIRPKEWLKLC